MTADPRARWAKELAVPPDATADAATAAFLRALPGAGFAPAPVQVAALNALAGTGAPVGPDYAAEELLRDEVEGFAKEYWSLEPGERLARWAELSRRGAEVARLCQLEPGLDVPASPLPEPGAGELAALMRELFVLPPRDRAIRRNTWLAGCVADEAKWRDAFAAVRREAPALAALDAQLAAALSQPLAALGEAAEAGTAAPRRRMSGEAALAEYTARLRQYERGRTQEEYEAADSARAKKFLAWFAGVGLLMMLSCCIRGTGNRPGNSSAYKPPPGAFDAKPVAPQPWPAPVVPGPNQYRPSGGGYPVSEYKPPADDQFSAADVAGFERYERGVAARGTALFVPQRYYDWVWAGRPGAGSPPPGAAGHITCSFDQTTIAGCLLYHRNGGPQPPGYALWARAGKPVDPGAYPLSEPPAGGR